MERLAAARIDEQVDASGPPSDEQIAKLRDLIAQAAKVNLNVDQSKPATRNVAAARIRDLVAKLGAK
jgi:hypothetical protein